MLRAQELSKRYVLASGTVQALKPFSYDFSPAKVTAILGPSGSGKSTLLNLLAGLDSPSSGSILLDGNDLSQLNESARAELRLKYFGFVFQSFNLINILNAWQNVAFPMGLTGLKQEKRKARAFELLSHFGLGERLYHFPHKLSGGERQRVALARALANNPEVIFADEPTGNLDSKSGAMVLDALFELAAEGRTVIIVTHNLELAKRADEVIFLKDGELTNAPVELGQPAIP
ncbi:MAG: ABC transporter ATP-binding protein [Trueperaceae bacterium]|nr:ABC transporter ATP-binding protein [Trueperaceae bacterium]